MPCRFLRVAAAAAVLVGWLAPAEAHAQFRAPDGGFEAATLHNVLHYADDPAAVLTEAARVLAPGGRLVVIDFAPHPLEFLRREHAHRRLGFTDAEIGKWFAAVGLEPEEPVRLQGDPLTVVIWSGRRSGALEHLPSQRLSAGEVA